MPLLDRGDATLTRGLLLAIAVVAPVLLVGLPLLDWVRGEPLVWAGAVDRQGEVPGAVAGSTVRWNGGVDVTVDGAPAGLWLLTLATGVVLALAVVAVALLLRRVVGDVRAGRPFTQQGLRALRGVGLVVASASILVPVLDGVATSAVLDHAVADDGLSLAIDFSPLWLLAGVLVLVVAEAFRHGLELTHDVDGLV
ncbi:hypothetical protein GCM10023340_14700 [Nocardioides marinquilinus]|uniref:DUF2975 domain-containing protein n=1 Tax=Nocardioides marinquilinus TaxID=1210400 RepID=A0ABP9PET5_9ACTN